MSRILAAMSGGVDSSVAAAILAGEGHEVVGVSLQLADASRGGEVSRCCSAADLRDARQVAGALGIPYYVFNEEDAFGRDVLDPFLAAYASGRTPNPCVRCNSALKFGTLLRIARALGAERVATGHYARVASDPITGRRILRRGADHAKDQSYFLFDLDQDQLAAAVFPLGEKTKDQVYTLAAELGLSVAHKPESQDLCFIPGGDVRAYLRRRLGEGRPGEIVDREGAVLGRHCGIQEFTIGQRRGIGVAGPRPLYVIGIDAGSDQVLVGEEADQYEDALIAEDCRLHDPDLWRAPFEAKARIRSRHEASSATVAPLPDRRLHVRFNQPQRAVTPGQALVLYRGDDVLGGGWIAGPDLDSKVHSSLACAWSSTERA